MKKFVHESLTDVLKPKPKEELADITASVINRANNEFQSIEYSIKDLKKSKRNIPQEVWLGDYQQTYDRLLAAFYDLPDYFQPQFVDIFDDLHVKLSRLI